MSKTISFKFKMILSAIVLLSTAACSKFTAMDHDQARLKETNGTAWGVPVPRPVTFGFTGISNQCASNQEDCKLKK